MLPVLLVADQAFVPGLIVASSPKKYLSYSSLSHREILTNSDEHFSACLIEGRAYNLRKSLMLTLVLTYRSPLTICSRIYYVDID